MSSNLVVTRDCCPRSSLSSSTTEETSSDDAKRFLSPGPCGKEDDERQTVGVGRACRLRPGGRGPPCSAKTRATYAVAAAAHFSLDVHQQIGPSADHAGVDKLPGLVRARVDAAAVHAHDLVKAVCVGGTLHLREHLNGLVLLGITTCTH